MSNTVLNYLRCHPEAADTLEGIVSWWLPRQRYEETRAKVQATLDELVARGQILRTALSDGTVLYSSAHPNAAPDKR